jgi:hypothetical protein
MGFESNTMTAAPSGAAHSSRRPQGHPLQFDSRAAIAEATAGWDREPESIHAYRREIGCEATAS